MKENSDGNDTNVGSIGNSIEEDIKILEKFKNDEMQRDKLERDVRCGGWKIGDIYKCLELDNAIDNILSDYKRVLKENEELKAKWDKDTHILQNKLDYANADRIDLAQQNKELRKENEELNNRCRNLDTEAQAYLEELAGDNTLTRRTIKQLQEENEELKNKYATFIKMSSEVPQNCIPTSLVKEKIEEYKACGIEEGDYHIFQEEINALQDLLERGEGR